MPNSISAKNLIYFTLFFSPAYLIRFSIFKIPLNLLDILILLTMGIWIYENNLHLLEKIKKSLRKIIFILPPIALILLGLFISALLNNNLLRELGIIKSWFILPIIFGFITFVEIKKNLEFDKILNAIFFSSSFISIISLLYLTLGQSTYDGRINAFYLSPNHLAMIIAPGFLIGCWKLVTKKNINYYLIIYLVLMALSLFYTHSYATWISIFFSIFVIFISARKKYLLILIIVILFFFSLEYNSDKFKNIFNYSASSSLKSRLVIWQVSEKIIFDNWLWGIGAGNFQEKYLSYQKYFTPYPQWAVPQPHNIFLAFWLQTGLIGLIGFLYLIIAWSLKTIKILTLSKDSTEKNLSLILLAIIFSMLITGLFDTPYWKNDLSLIFWTIISVGSSRAVFIKEEF
ncbi:MAG: hypothetical protein ACD_7C00461G0002 [uncultured bacterium]|nr:MAG: hypothetical protein ACD_7C00461G0002 [uncultured bacterium]HBR79734.1 hypothetical protein [Candidatus Moranbacteria bacterium]